MNVFRYEAQIHGAVDRWENGKKQREERAKASKKRPGVERRWWDIDTAERIQQRLASKGMMAEAEAVESWKESHDPLPFDPLERILDDDELVSATTLFQGAALTYSVARVVVRAPSGRIRGFGTGFLVSSRLLLTNNHVLESVREARPSTVEFFFWEDLAGRRGQQVDFQLEPDVFFETDEPLDFSLVAVAERGAHAVQLARLGWSPFIGTSGKSTVGEPVSIIQHPRGEPQQVVLRENKITDVIDDFLHYQADTMRGSSGSPVFNVDWELAALHHSGVPARRNGRILLRDGRVWNGDPSLADQIHWIANEGVRISSIVAELRRRSAGWDVARQQLFEQCFRARPAFDVVVPGIAAPPLPPASEPPAPARTDDADDDFDVTERIDRDYSSRRGYRASFLGSGRFRVPLPTIGGLSSEGDGRELDYQNFTVVMNRRRRLAWYTAVNVHGRLLRRIRRSSGQTRWVFDTRLPRSEQIGNDLYRGTEIDRGHLVRRLDPSWGTTRERALRGNNDTFHYTNSAPQHADFNEDDEAWAGLEDYFLDNLEDRDRKATVFTGPVFRDNDPLFESPQGESARIPRQYWKVLVYRRSGRLSASAYLLSQEEVLQDDLGLEDFGDGAFATFQLPLAELEELAGLDFGELRELDSFQEGFEERFDESSLLEGAGGRHYRRLEAAEDAAL